MAGLNWQSTEEPDEATLERRLTRGDQRRDQEL